MLIHCALEFSSTVLIFKDYFDEFYKYMQCYLQ